MFIKKSVILLNAIVFIVCAFFKKAIFLLELWYYIFNKNVQHSKWQQKLWIG